MLKCGQTGMNNWKDLRNPSSVAASYHHLPEEVGNVSSSVFRGRVRVDILSK